MRILGLASALASMTVLSFSVWSQTPNPGDPPTAPSIISGPTHAAHPTRGSTDILSGGAMHEEDPRQTAGTDPDPVATRAAADFLTKATLDGMTEVELGKLAISRSHNDAILKFAQQMVADYDESNTALAAVAVMKNISLPKEIDASQQSLIQALSSKQGRMFDKAYVDQMVNAHQHAIPMYTAAAGQTDSEIAAFAYKALPMLKVHRQMAQSLKVSV